MSSEAFEENLKFLLPAKDASIDQDAFRKLTSEYPEIAKGYTIAMSEILPHIEAIFRSPTKADSRAMTLALLKQVRGLLHFYSGLDSVERLNSDAKMPPAVPE